MTTGITNRQASVKIARREVFKTSNGTVRGVAGFEGFGRLPGEHCTDDLRASKYVVYSYATPIAYLAPSGRWVRPAVKYSPTTSCHQGMCPVSDPLVFA